MCASWMIPTQNDPLGTLRGVIRTLWETTRLDRILLPLNGNAEVTGPRILESPNQIQAFNPFTPLMPINAAQLVPDLVSSGKRAAAVLRPCEMRTLNGMVKLGHINIENLLTVSVDCLGTLPIDEFEWRALRRGSPKGLAQEALQFAPQGDIVPYRYRAACQICESPEATQADVNIGVLGLPVRQYLLFTTRDESIAQQLKSSDALPINDAIILQHQRVTTRLAERGKETRQHIFTGLGGMLPANIDKLIEPLQGCGDCHACMAACPICTKDFPRQVSSAQYIREDLIDWLLSCSECGICEQSCPKHLPLTIIFGHIHDQLAEMRQADIHYGTA